MCAAAAAAGYIPILRYNIMRKSAYAHRHEIIIIMRIISHARPSALRVDDDDGDDEDNIMANKNEK